MIHMSLSKQILNAQCNWIMHDHVIIKRVYSLMQVFQNHLRGNLQSRKMAAMFVVVLLAIATTCQGKQKCFD